MLGYTFAELQDDNWSGSSISPEIAIAATLPGGRRPPPGGPRPTPSPKLSTFASSKWNERSFCWCRLFYNSKWTSLAAVSFQWEEFCSELRDEKQILQGNRTLPRLRLLLSAIATRLGAVRANKYARGRFSSRSFFSVCKQGKHQIKRILWIGFNGGDGWKEALPVASMNGVSMVITQEDSKCSKTWKSNHLVPWITQFYLLRSYITSALWHYWWFRLHFNNIIYINKYLKLTVLKHFFVSCKLKLIRMIHFLKLFFILLISFVWFNSLYWF